jgi:DNA (cytosine-5)-methyltransferase 1
MHELALFAGAGGGILGGKLLGWRTICAVEWEQYPASVLCARQNDGFLPTFPIWDDVQTFDGKPWKGVVDVVSGGFPCQDISAAGKGAGIDGGRSGMWKHMARIIGEVQPAFAFIENSPLLRTRGLGVVLQDLAKMGYNARWGVLSAASVGANHKRDRMWIVGKATNATSLRPYNEENQRVLESQGRSELQLGKPRDTTEVADTSQHGIQSQPSKTGKSSQWINASGIGNREWWEVEPDVGRVADGVAARVDRLKAIGNGQVPLCAATAWRMLSKELYATDPA